MPKVTVGRENSADIEIHYEDHGAGQPVVLTAGQRPGGRAWAIDFRPTGEDRRTHAGHPGRRRPGATSTVICMPGEHLPSGRDQGGPHAIPWTHADHVNTALLFLDR